MTDDTRLDHLFATPDEPAPGVDDHEWELNGSTPHHVVPGMYRWFDAPDIQAALAPRPLLYTEGGRSLHISRVRAAYKMAGAQDNVKVHYYRKYETTDSRHYDDQPIPEGLTDEEYYLYANVDVVNHRFHPEHAVPWLTGIFAAKTN